MGAKGWQKGYSSRGGGLAAAGRNRLDGRRPPAATTAPSLTPTKLRPLSARHLHRGALSPPLHHSSTSQPCLRYITTVIGTDKQTAGPFSGRTILNCFDLGQEPVESYVATLGFGFGGLLLVIFVVMDRLLKERR